MTKHKHTFCSIFILYIMFFYFGLNAQVQYPTDSSFISTVSNADKSNLNIFKNSKIDTAVNNFQNYYPRNTNGNLGLPSAPLYINYQYKPIGFNMITAPYQFDMISANDVNYYKTKGPYASLTGIAGSKQEQMFKLLFSHTLKNKVNITLAFNRYGGLGFYKRQQTFTNNFYTSSNYTSTNGRVGYYAHFLYNKVKHQENGGLKSDTSFLQNASIIKLLLAVNLTEAKREYRNTKVDINPWFRLNEMEDSSTIFSHFIDYNFNYSGSYTKYTDTQLALDNYYNTFYLDTATTKDSTHWRTISNAFNYTLKFNPINANLKFGYKNEINQVYQYLDSSFINNSINAGLYISDKEYIGFVKIDYIFNGPNANDYSFEINNRYLKTFRKIPFAFNFNVNAEKRHPDFIFNTWLTNNYAWRNNFSPTDKIQSTISLSTTDERFGVGVVYQTVKNFVYFNEFALPDQTPVAIQNISAFIRKDVLLFKHLGINAGYKYQASSNQTIVSVPNHIVNGSLYYQGNLFKRALQLQIGFSAQYFSQFYGYAYMPATNQYYVQTTNKVGNYPYVDFFLNARIKPVRIFVKVDHVTQGLLGTNYSLTPGYLQNGRAIKFGLNWVFFD